MLVCVGMLPHEKDLVLTYRADVICAGRLLDVHDRSGVEGKHAQDLGPHCVDPFYLDHCDLPIVQANQNHLRLIKRESLVPKMFPCPHHVGDFIRD
jgi:hypothetical protein